MPGRTPAASTSTWTRSTVSTSTSSRSTRMRTASSRTTSASAGRRRRPVRPGRRARQPEKTPQRPGFIATCTFPLTNTGAAGTGIFDSDIYRISATSSSEDWEVTLPNALAAAKAGQTVQVPVHRGRPRAARARHRYGGLGPRARGAQQHRRAEAEPRAALGPRRRAGLPHARLRLGVRADRRRRLGGARRLAGPIRPIPIRARGRSAPPGAAPPGCGSACRSPGSGCSSATASAAGLRGGARALARARRADRRDRHRAVPRDRAAAL